MVAPGFSRPAPPSDAGGMRLLLPLLPAWLVGAWLLLWSDSVWDPKAMGPNLHGERMAPGWMLVATLLVGTALYLGAPRLGRTLAISSVSSMTVGLGESNATQRGFGAGVVRVGALLGMYAVVASLALLLSRPA